MRDLLRTPSVGPIVGHTSSNSSRIWMRGAAAAPGRTVGVAALYDAAGHYIANSACYFRLHRKHDRTGITDFTGLQADTAYVVRAGSLSLDSSNSAAMLDDREVYARLPRPEDLRGDLEKLPAAESLASFTTYPINPDKGLSFIFGSCRYPGLFWPAKKSDRIFGAILEKFLAANAPRFLIMNGDQIYADKISRKIPFFRADTAAEYRERYLSAFTSPHMRALMQAVPSYMILDDHEIEDDWNVGRLDGDEKKRAKFAAAMAAYKNYQWLHSPRNYSAQGEVAAGRGDQLFYSFECAGYPFFALDSRSQRIQQDGQYQLDANHMLGQPSRTSAAGYSGQINMLCEWLLAQQNKIGNRPKFIITPSPFVPNGIETAGRDERARRKKCEDDAWAAFPETRRQLLQAIVGGNIQNVIFLCGDAHSSCVAEMSFTHKTSGNLPLRALAITSSAFYWPWFFSDGKPDSYVHDSAKQHDHFEVNAAVVMNYKACAFEQADNFSRIDVSEKGIAVQNFASDGKPLGSVTTLSLATG